MNFMRANYQDKKQKWTSMRDINFFKTVREGSRRLERYEEGDPRAEGLSLSGGTISTVVGRTVLRAGGARQTRQQPPPLLSPPPPPLLPPPPPQIHQQRPSVYQILNSGVSPPSPPTLSSGGSGEGLEFFQCAGDEFPMEKQMTREGGEIWEFGSGGATASSRAPPLPLPAPQLPPRTPASGSSPLFATPKNPAPRPKVKKRAQMFIEESAENECSQYRMKLERMRQGGEEAEEGGSGRGGGLEDDVFSERSSVAGGDEMEGEPPLLQQPPSGLVTPYRSRPRHPSPPPPPRSPPLSSPKRSYSSLVTPVTSSRENQASSKIPPETGTRRSTGGSSSDQMAALFSTPSGLRSLPRITTPHLFQPYEKTPSKTTPSNTKTSSKTPQSSSRDSYYVISLTEGRGHAVCEVGLAALDLNHPVLILSQFSDSQTYKNTLTKINLLDPAELLVPDTFTGDNRSVLFKTVTDSFPEIRVMAVKRQHFSAKTGIQTISALQLPELSSIQLTIKSKYYALAAAEALVKYVEIKHGKLYAPKSLKVVYQSAKDIVNLDMETCRRLELVMSMADMIYPEKYSLFGLMDRTKTLGGRRRLRISLLQPSSSLEFLLRRQHTVQALVDNQRSLAALQNNLLKFSSVERLLWLCLRTPNFKNEGKTFEMFTNYILLLKSSLEAIPHLTQVLEDIDDDHIIDIRNELSDNRYCLILKRILQMIKEDAQPSKSYAEGQKQRCFAIKDGVNELLDVARATYSNLIQTVMDKISELGREHGLPLRMTNSSDYGFHPSFVLPKNVTFCKEELPDIFTDFKVKLRTVHLLTDEIYLFNMRIQRALQEIQLITNVVINELVESLRGEVSLFYRLCDHISELDLLSCLAQVSSTPDFAKPVFSSGETALVGARHPILDYVRPNRPIPNNVFSSKEKNFTIVTGPNMGGKTVYVLMIPLIQIMAQIGCFVPADEAKIRIVNHIYVKYGSRDSIEQKLSSFSMEVNELNSAISSISDSSLIILDEICTGIKSDEGTAIAWAYCEELIKRPAFTFLTTHYHYLTNLSKVYSNVTNFHMEGIERELEGSRGVGGLTFTYRLLPGVTNLTNYALKFIMSSALPDSIKDQTLEIVQDLVRERAASLPLVMMETPTTANLHAKIEKVEEFMKNLYSLSLTEDFTKERLSTLQQMAKKEILSENPEKE